MSAQLMQSGWGKALLILIGLVVLAVGGYHVYKGISERFLKDLRVSGGRGITAIGVVGYVAKGLVLAGAGLLVIVATLNSDPSKSTGIDSAVKTLGQAPFGKVLLVVAAAGLAAFAAYSFVRSRHGRMCKTAAAARMPRRRSFAGDWVRRRTAPQRAWRSRSATPLCCIASSCRSVAARCPSGR